MRRIRHIARRVFSHARWESGLLAIGGVLKSGWPSYRADGVRDRCFDQVIFEIDWVAGIFSPSWKKL